MQSLTDDNALVRHQYINLAILALYFVSENDLYYYSPKQELVLLYSFSLLLLQHAETIDIGTCDQSVPKAYPDKGTPQYIPHWWFYYQFCMYPFPVMWNVIRVFVGSYYMHFFYVLLADDDRSGNMAHHSYNGPADVGKTNDEGRWIFQTYHWLQIMLLLFNYQNWTNFFLYK